jgi:hypothetical protein
LRSGHIFSWRLSSAVRLYLSSWWLLCLCPQIRCCLQLRLSQSHSRLQFFTFPRTLT